MMIKPKQLIKLLCATVVGNFLISNKFLKIVEIFSHLRRTDEQTTTSYKTQVCEPVIQPTQVQVRSFLISTPSNYQLWMAGRKKSQPNKNMCSKHASSGAWEWVHSFSHSLVLLSLSLVWWLMSIINLFAGVTSQVATQPYVLFGTEEGSNTSLAWKKDCYFKIHWEKKEEFFFLNFNFKNFNFFKFFKKFKNLEKTNFFKKKKKKSALFKTSPKISSVYSLARQLPHEWNSCSRTNRVEPTAVVIIIVVFVIFHLRLWQQWLGGPVFVSVFLHFFLIAGSPVYNTYS